ncbi:MAG: TonB-dependent receptor [Nitrospira sp. SB0662_bin_26]|nr:TonB-dependent receptor [Nitrospira sp. SB0662_bin_26]
MYNTDRRLMRRKELRKQSLLTGINALWCLLVLSPSAGLAESSIETLDPVLVTATTLPTNQSQTPLQTKVFTRTGFDLQQPNRLGTLLQQTPGIFVDEMGGRSGLSSLYIRGSDPNYTMVLLDGVPLNDPTNQRGGSVDLSSLTPERIERIEIVKGPASVFYGSDAMAGAVNIITQKGSAKDRLVARAEGGQWGYARGVLQASGTAGRFRYAGSAAVTRDDGQVTGNRFASGTIGGHMNWSRPDSLKLELTGQYTHTDTRSFPEGSGGPRLAILRSTEQRRTHEVASGFNLTFPLAPNWEHQLTANVLHRQQKVDNPGVLSAPGMFRIPPTVFRTDFTRMRFHWTLRASLNRLLKIAGGVQLVHENGTRTGIQDLTVLGLSSQVATDFEQSRATPAGILETIFSPNEQVRLSAGLRVDSPEDLPLRATPRLGVSIQPFPQTIIHGTYGQGFKLPSLNALGDPIIGNSRLTPESSTAWEVGILRSSTVWDSEIRLTWFHNTFFNQIDLDPVLAKQQTFLLVNLNKVRTQGIELNVATNPLPDVSIQGWFTYLDARISGTNAPLRNRPKASGGFAIRVRATPALTIRSQLQAVGTRFDLQIPTTQTRVPGYYRMDLATTYALNDAWNIFGAVDNLTNVKYEDFLGFSAPGTWVRFGVEGHWE